MRQLPGRAKHDSSSVPGGMLHSGSAATFFRMHLPAVGADPASFRSLCKAVGSLLFFMSCNFGHRVIQCLCFWEDIFWSLLLEGRTWWRVSRVFPSEYYYGLRGALIYQ